MLESGWLEGFSPANIEDVTARAGRGESRCISRKVLKGFLDSGHDAISKPLKKEALLRNARNLRNYRKLHFDEFGEVGISTRGGKLTLYRIAAVDSVGSQGEGAIGGSWQAEQARRVESLGQPEDAQPERQPQLPEDRLLQVLGSVDCYRAHASARGSADAAGPMSC